MPTREPGIKVKRRSARYATRRHESVRRLNKLKRSPRPKTYADASAQPSLGCVRNLWT